MKKSTFSERTALGRYITGFIVSLAATLIVYFFVQNRIAGGHQVLSHTFLMISIALLAIIQFVVQAVFFLHIGKEPKPRVKMIAFFFMLLIVVILVGGSIWIMNNLDYTMMTPEQTKTYLQNNEGL